MRLLALEVCDELFGRSKRFRALLCARLTHALELMVGFKPSNPLPPPADTATALRARALEALERWHALFGTKYQQVRPSSLLRTCMGSGCVLLAAAFKRGAAQGRARSRARPVAVR